MGMHAEPAMAVVIAPDQDARQLAGFLLEDCGYLVRDVESSEAALQLLACDGLDVGVCFAEFLNPQNGADVEFARDLERDYPWIKVVISASAVDLVPLPRNASRINHPWLPLDVIFQAERVKSAQRLARLGSH